MNQFFTAGSGDGRLDDTLGQHADQVISIFSRAAHVCNWSRDFTSCRCRLCDRFVINRLPGERLTRRFGEQRCRTDRSQSDSGRNEVLF